MPVRITPKMALETLVRASIHLERLSHVHPLQGLFLRSFEQPERAFIPKAEKGWLSRSIDRLRTRGVTVTLYDLEANVAHFETLVTTAVKGLFDAEKSAHIQRLQDRLSIILVTSKRSDLVTRITKTKELFTHSISAYSKMQSELESMLKSFLQDGECALASAECIQKLFSEYEALMHEITVQIAKNIASKEDQDEARKRIEKEALQIAEKRLRHVFDAIKVDYLQKMKAAKTLEQFQSAKNEFQSEIRVLIEMDRHLHEEPLCKLFCSQMKVLCDAVQVAEMPIYSAHLQAEVLPKIEQFFMEAAKKEKREELTQIVVTIDQYLLFLRQVLMQLQCPYNAPSCPESQLLDQAIVMLEKGKQTIERRIGEIPSVQQHVSGTGNTVIVGDNVTITTSKGMNQGSQVQEDERIFPQTGWQALSFGSSVLLSAAMTYLSGGVSLGLSLVTGVAFTAAPSVARIAARQVLPGPVVELMDPVVDFAARLLVFSYGGRAVQALSGATAAQVPSATSTLTTAIKAHNIARSVQNNAATAAATQSAPSSSSFFSMEPTMVGKAIVYLSTLWAYKKAKRAVVAS